MAETTRSPGPPSSRDKILDVAEALFARSGYAGVGLRAVATEAGLGKSSLFHHFPSKADLYLAVLRRVIERLGSCLRPSLDAGIEPLARLDAALDALVDALAEQPNTSRLLLRSLFEEEQFPAAADGAEAETERELFALLAQLRELIESGVRAGAFARVDAAQLLQTLIGATVYHFASGDFGERLLGQPLFSAEAVSARKRELKALLHHGLARPQSAPNGDRS